MALLAFAAVAGAGKELPKQVQQADTVVWAGIDYSRVKMIGTQDFKNPDAIFPGFLNTWNALFVKEMVPKLASRLDKKVVVDNDGMAKINQKAKTSQVIQEDGGKEMVETCDLKDENIAAMVKAYKLKATDGVGLVFIVDRLVKQQEQGCVTAVFFDIASREVLSSRRGIYKAGGFGFRNYWFRPVKNAIDDLK